MSELSAVKHRDTPVRPTGSDYSLRARRLNQVSEAIQKPATMYTGIGAILGTVGCIAFGVTPVGLAATLGLAFLSGTSGLYQYYINGEQLEQSYLEKLRQRTITWENYERQSIQQECRRLRNKPAEEAWQRLCTSIDRANEFIDRLIKPERAKRAQELQEYVSIVFYRCSLLLRRVIEINKSISISEVQTAEHERDIFQQRLTATSDPDDQAKLQDKIANRELLINDYQQKMTAIKTMLDEVDDIEIRLERSLLNLKRHNTSEPQTLLEDSNSSIMNFEEQLTATIEVDRHFRELDLQ